jgi:DNA ligase (NAD+)
MIYISIYNRFMQKNMNFNITEINNDPIGFIKKNKKKDIIEFLTKADDAFFNNDNDLIKDDVYDIIKDYIYKKYPKDKYFKRIGADVKNKVILPYYMGSQNKIKDSEEELTKYKAKYGGPYVVSDKLDGVSCLITYSKEDIKIYTRGNGTEGQDITHLLEYINGIPKLKIADSGISNNIAVRGELIISKSNWDVLGVMGKQGANPRNTLSGAINSDILNKDILSKVDFVAYSLINPKMSNGFTMLQEKSFNVVNHKILNTFDLTILSNILQERRDIGNYVIDGIVVSDISKYYEIHKDKNPEHSFAFKSIHTLEQVEVIVTKVEWNVSKDMYMKPIVMFKEIELDNVKIKQATGFNGSFIEKNIIGPGSRIIIIRSGNVIPHILTVLTPSANGSPSMPGTEGVDYKWNDTRVDIMMISKVGDKNRDYDIKNLQYFMKTAEIEYMGPGNISKIYDAGFDDIKKIVNITEKELLAINGFKEKMVHNIINALSKIKEIDCLILMDASNIMGRGFSHKKIKLITDAYPCILSHDKKNRLLTSKINVEDLLKVEGIAETSAKLFLNNLPKFYEFYDNLGFKCKEKVNTAIVATSRAVINNNIAGKSFVFTGFRDKDLEAYITGMGGFIKTTISKNTNYLVVSDLNENSGKAITARSLGVPLILRDNNIFDRNSSQHSQHSLHSLHSPHSQHSLHSQHSQHIFKELPSSKEDRFTLVTFQNHFRPTNGQGVKVIFADLDHTLITPKGKHVFPKSIDDWKWKNDAIVPKLKEMYNDMGYEIVIVSNQKKMTGEEVRKKTKMIYDDLQIPFVFISGHSDLYYRKPQLGLWEVLIEYIFKDINNIDKSSIFLGDSSVDLYFARNTNLKFIHTDMFFTGVQHKEFAKIEDKKHPMTEWISDKVQNIIPPLKHLVVMVGSPASGKSFYSRELEKSGYLRINKDDMKSDKIIQKEFDNGIKEGRNIVIDGTNATKEIRSKWINAVKAATAATSAKYYVTIVWMNFPMSVAEFLDNYRIAMNKNQKTHVPAVALRVYYKKLEEPSQTECDNLIEIKTINTPEMLSVWL